MNVKGILEEVAEIKQLRSGTKGDGTPWVLWGTTIKAGGKKYGFSNFEKAKLEEFVKNTPLGSTIEFEIEQKGRYTNVKQDTTIQVIEKGSGQAPPQAAPAPQPKIELPTKEAIVQETKTLADKLVEGINEDSSYVLKTRLDVFKELMLDRRTMMIQGFKQNNMAAFRGD